MSFLPSFLGAPFNSPSDNRDFLFVQGSLLVTTYVLVAVACWFEDAGDGLGEGYSPPPPST